MLVKSDFFCLRQEKKNKYLGMHSLVIREAKEKLVYPNCPQQEKEKF